MAPSAIIIGAGIAGLSAGCYAQMNSCPTTVFEQHDQPGGLCTSWRRDGYVFDGCLQWLVGSAPGSSLHSAWEELGALAGRQMVNHDEFTRIVAADGTALIVYTDVDRLERHLRELAPEDAAAIEHLTDLVRFCTRLDLPLGAPRELLSPLAKIKLAITMLPFVWLYARYGRLSFHDYLKRFQSRFLRTALAELFDLPDFPLVAVVMTLAWHHKRTAGYPIGGSLEFIRAIERRYCELGGKVTYGAQVTKILVEQGSDGRRRATGVRLADGSEHRADHVISAADGHRTLYDMLEGRFLDDSFRAIYEDRLIFPPILRVSLGIARDLTDEPHAVTQLLDPPVDIAGVPQHSVHTRHYCYDPTMAERGKSSVAVVFSADYDHWHHLARDESRYAEEKKRVAEAAIDLLEQRFAGIRAQIEVVDVATPITVERYTGNWRGSPEGVLVTTKNLTSRLSQTLRGLDGFYMAGQWVGPGGGLPTGVMTGRAVAQLICARDGRSFRTSRPRAAAADRTRMQ